MFRSIRSGASSAVTVAALAALPFASSAVAQEMAGDDHGGFTVEDLFAGSSTLTFYGFFHVEAANDTARLNSPETPQFVNPEGGDNDEAQFTLHAELTRLGATFDGPTLAGLGDAKVGGRIEVDFQEGGSESRARLRMRRAYGQLTWDDWGLLVGQDWDLISPQMPFVNQDTLLWNAGNTGDRRTQVRLTYGQGTGVNFGVALAAAGAVENRTVVGGLTSGEASGRPMIQARLGYKTEGGVNVGLWGHQSEERFDNGSGEEDFDSNSFGVDFFVPFNDGATWLKGEAYSGENVDDIRGGIAQGVNAAGDEIASTGGWLEIGHHLNENWTVAIGATQEDPDEDDLANGARDTNSVVYGGARWQQGDVKIALELMNWTTEYVGGAEGDALRAVLWFRYSF